MTDSTKLTKGTRVYPDDEDGELWLADGEYGYDPRDGHWKGRPPGQGLGDFTLHSVTEHEDGSITVEPSILITTEDDDCQIRWHGYLEKGIWRRCD